MNPSQAAVEQTQAQVKSLEDAGVWLGGNAFSRVCIIKGVLSNQEATGEIAPLAGADGQALKASLTRLGFGAEEWCWLLVQDRSGAPLSPTNLRTAISTLDPECLILCDEVARDAVREAYAEDLTSNTSLTDEQVMLLAGQILRVCGMRVACLDNFEQMILTQEGKRAAWATLRQMAALGAPY